MTLTTVFGNTDTVKLKPSNVTNWMRHGLNIFEMYAFDANGWRWDKEYETPVQAKNMAWGWVSSQSDNVGNEDCGVINAGGKIADVSCANTHRYACFDNASSAWFVSENSGQWQDGLFFTTQCSRVSSAIRLVELDALNRAIEHDSPDSLIWVNYTDMVHEGERLANQTWNKLSPNFWLSTDIMGGFGGSEYDDIDQLKYDLYRDRRRVTRVSMSAGNRVDKIGFTYSDGQTVVHGGNGFDRYLDLMPGEYIDKVSV